MGFTVFYIFYHQCPPPTRNNTIPGKLSTRGTSLNEIGGFDPVLTSEDYFAVAKLLLKGYKIAYVAESVVVHSRDSAALILSMPI